MQSKAKFRFWCVFCEIVCDHVFLCLLVVCDSGQWTSEVCLLSSSHSSLSVMSLLSHFRSRSRSRSSLYTETSSKLGSSKAPSMPTTPNESSSTDSSTPPSSLFASVHARSRSQPSSPNSAAAVPLSPTPTSSANPNSSP